MIQRMVSSVTNDGVLNDRTYNQQNELTSINDGAMLYNANGDYIRGGYRGSVDRGWQVGGYSQHSHMKMCPISLWVGI
ncbi:MAG TPA: hypothetical protein VFE58_02050 [Tepidisphaeraceae bacterium]|nr:hypothetical protein [Tepidisphaeraceae bacterium]